MAIYFFDTSALINRYVDEPGTLWVRQICDAVDPKTTLPANLVVIGSIPTVEVASALSILERRQVISKRVGEHAYENYFVDLRNGYQVLEISPDLLLAAADLARRFPLKAYDAVQLALALAVKETLRQDEIALTFVSGDTQLLQAAQNQGLVVENPFTHAQFDDS